MVRLIFLSGLHQRSHAFIQWWYFLWEKNWIATWTQAIANKKWGGVNSKWRNQSVSLEWNGECYHYWSFIPSTWERWSASWRVLISDRRYQTVRRDRPVCLYSCRLAVCELGPGSKSLAVSEGPVSAWNEMRCHLITLCT